LKQGSASYTQYAIPRAPNPSPSILATVRRPLLEHISRSLGRLDSTEERPRRIGSAYGYLGESSGGIVGVQCKGKDANLGATLTEDELRNEVEKAKGFKPCLATWTLATTASKDARIEEIARQITVEHQANGLFEVRVLGWEDLVSLMQMLRVLGNCQKILCVRSG
jgi:hypothetical protein